MRKIWLVAAALALPLLAAAPLPTAPKRYVTDAANVIDDSRELALNERLAQFARETSNQVLVYVDRDLPAGSASIEEMGAAAIRTWRVGDTQKDNGAILFLFVGSRDSRIEVGYGLEEKLTDARAKRILVGLRPDLRVGDYATATEAGVTEIIAAITGETPEVTEAAPAVTEPARVRQFMPRTTPPVQSDVNEGFLIAFVLFGGIVFVMVIIVIVKNGGIEWSSGSQSSSTYDPSSSSFNDSSSSWPSSDSSSSSGSDFSGGGGSGGGGGASDKW
ncbi:MAG: uncharacterized protein QOJ98_3514 [Acidobacteriota bacterium]|nr:uncharacterized protein [Acidobacteriota bacterium]